MRNSHSEICYWKIIFLPIICFLVVSSAYGNDDDIIDFLPIILSAGKNETKPPPPTSVDYTGVWSIHEVATSQDPGCTYETDFTATVIEQDAGVFSVDFGHKTAQGTIIEGLLVVSFSGTYEEEGGTTTSEFSGTFSHNTTTGYSFAGTETWSWTDGDYSCSGSSTFTGFKNSA